MRISHFLAPLALLTLPLAAAATSSVDEELGTRDQEKLGKLVAEYFEAKEERKGINEAFEEIQDWVAKTQKKRKGASPLALVEDLQRAFYHARMATVGKSKIKKGMIADEELGSGADFVVYARKDYNAKKGPYPLVLVVPDKNVKPRQCVNDSWRDSAGRETGILAAVPMPNNTRFWTELSDSDESGVATIMWTYRHMLDRFAVDMERVYLAGEGEGIGAALATAAAFPHLFAGVICRGAGLSFDPTNFSNVPTLFVAGGAHATEFQSRAQELGFDNCTVETALDEPAIWAWMAPKKRAVAPERVVMSPTTPYTSTGYWITLMGIDVEENPRVEASVDRETNTITVQADKATAVKLHLNDLLVGLGDAENPLTVVVNGVTHEQVVPRNLRTMLDTAFITGDSGRIFTNVLTFDVPVAETGESKEGEEEEG